MISRRRITVGLSSFAALGALAFAGVDASSGLAKAPREGAPPMVTTPLPTTPTAPATTPTATTISTAADNSATSRGYRYLVSVSERVPAQGTLKVSGSGTYSTANRSGTGKLALRFEGKTLRIQEIFRGTTFYVKEPPSVARQLPGGKPWLKLDLSKAHGKYLKSLAAVLNGSSEDNPTQFLNYLSDESNNVAEVGPATVDGVPTTRYHASVDLAKAGAGQPAALHQAAQKVLQSIPGTVVNEHAVPVDAWVDGSQLVRRAQISLTLKPRGTTQTVTTTVTIDIPSYGPQATPPPPPANQTLDLLALLKSEGASLAG